MRTKLSALKEHMASGQWDKAIRLAASFPRLGDHERPIQLAREALNRPAFMRQLRKDPDTLIEQGKAALMARYGE